MFEDAQPWSLTLNSIACKNACTCDGPPLSKTDTSVQFYMARIVLPLESVVSVLACIMMAAGNPSNGRHPAAYFYLSTKSLL